MSGFTLDVSLLKEPLGFIRVLEWVFSIFAFASTGGYSGNTSFNVRCQKTVAIHMVNISFGYPFRLNNLEYTVPECKVNGSTNAKYHLTGNHASSAEFFIAIGVHSFLYCTVILVVYLGYKHVYRESSRWPVLDLLVTGAITFLWLVSSCAWAKGLTDVKSETSPVTLISVIGVCKDVQNSCTPGAVPSFGSLNSSVISGFLNVILWGETCWLVFKETPFHKSSAPAPAQQERGRLP